MNVCLVSSTFPPQKPANFCGVGDYSARLSRALAESGQTVTVLTSTAYTGLREPVSRLMIEPLVHGWKFNTLPRILRFLDEQRVAVVNLQYQPDVLGSRWSLFNTFLGLALRGPERRLVTTMHSIAHPAVVSPTRLTARALAALSDGLVVTNEHHRSELCRMYPSAASKTYLVPVGSNIEPTPEQWTRRAKIRDDVRAELGVGSHESLLASFGRIYRSKGFTTLLHAFGGLQSKQAAHLVIVGHVAEKSSEYRAALEQLGAALGIGNRIHWKSDVEDAVVAEYLLATDLYVVPFDDGLSTRRTSAMAGFACGLPVVSTLGTDIAKVFVPGQNVVLVPPGDSDALCATLVELLQAPERRAALGRGALTVARHFTWSGIAREVTSVFEALGARNTPRVQQPG